MLKLALDAQCNFLFVRAMVAWVFVKCQCSLRLFAPPFSRIYARYHEAVSDRPHLPLHRAAAPRSLRFHSRRIPSRSRRPQGYARYRESWSSSGVCRREFAWRISTLFQTEAIVAYLSFAWPITCDVSVVGTVTLSCLRPWQRRAAGILIARQP